MNGFAMKPIDRWLRRLSEMIPQKLSRIRLLAQGREPYTLPRTLVLPLPEKTTDRAPADRIYSYQGVPTKTTAGLAVMREKPNRAHCRELGHAHRRDAPHWKNLSSV